jgi:hypothetical protein
MYGARKAPFLLTVAAMRRSRWTLNGSADIEFRPPTTLEGSLNYTSRVEKMSGVWTDGVVPVQVRYDPPVHDVIRLGLRTRMPIRHSGRIGSRGRLCQTNHCNVVSMFAIGLVQ